MTFRKTLAAVACLASLVALPTLALAAEALGPTEKQPTNWTAIVMFAAFVVFTLFITKWAASRTKSAADFYTAGGGITGFQNGLAIAGDYMSAASFLGISAAVMVSGYDGLIYSIGFLVGWPIITFLMAERLRNLGKFTFADVAAFRFEQMPVRVFAASGTLVVVAFYLIAQMVGAGQLIKLLFGLDYWIAVVIVGGLMMVYVLFGGMTATTWVQIIKACLLLGGATFMGFMVMWRYGFSPEALFQGAVDVKTQLAETSGDTPGEALQKGLSIMGPGTFIKDPISAISFGMALMFGTAGLPHILMRFFTVPSAKEARKSVMWATGWIGYFYLLTFIIGFGAITYVLTDPSFSDGTGTLIGGNNMAAVHLAQAVGGNVFLGFISAVAFATILAVVAGLTLSGASAVSHDIYSTVVKRGKADSLAELRVSRITTVCLGVLAVLLGIVFEKQNIAFMVSLAFAVAASANFPVLFMSVLWKDCTTRGAVIGGFLGLISSVALTVVSPSVWEATLGNPVGSAPFPYTSPALFSVTIGFVGIWLFSITIAAHGPGSIAPASRTSRSGRKPGSARRRPPGTERPCRGRIPSAPLSELGPRDARAEALAAEPREFVERAADPTELSAAAGQIDRLVRKLHADGARVEVITGLVGGLNRRLFQRLWELLAPEELRANSCLIVMGSEGRAEQIIKTDQDNGLLLRDGFVFDGLEAVTEAFTAALIDFGYPPCPGGIMLSRPLWRQPVAAFRESLRDWIHGADPSGPMNLAIFLDAAAVAGDAALLARARDDVDALLVDSDAFYARFARAVDQFGEDGWWSRLPGLRGRAAAEIDIKKLGTFPIVHGARTLTLRYRVRELGTAERLSALVAAGRIDAGLARDLTEALRFLIGLKLSNNLAQMAAGRAPDNRIRLADLGPPERRDLKGALATARRFRQWLARHYRLDLL